jgi:hypothetical protein
LTVAEASITAYRAHTSKGAAASQQAAILAVMQPGQRYSRRLIAGMAQIETSACAGRCNELIEQGRIVPAGKMKCPITGQQVEAVALPGYQDSCEIAGVAGVRSGRGASHAPEIGSSSSLLDNAHAGARTAQPGIHSDLQCEHLTASAGVYDAKCIKCCARLLLASKPLGKDRVLVQEGYIDYLRAKGVNVPSQDDIRDLVREHWGNA